MVGSKKVKRISLYTLAFLILLIMVYPYIYMVLNSLSPWNEVDRRFFPSEFTLKSYEWLLIGDEGSIPKPWFKAFLIVL